MTMGRLNQVRLDDTASEKRLIEDFPQVLEQAPELVKLLQEHYGWQKAKKPVEILENWSEQDVTTMYYFLGWFVMATENISMTAQLRFLSLSKRKELVKFIEECVVGDATSGERDAYRRGRKDTRKRK